MKRLEAEKLVQNVRGMEHVILRPAIVYGTGDLTGLSQWKHARNTRRVIAMQIPTSVHLSLVSTLFCSAAPRLACASVYQLLKEKMRFLWSDDLRLNVVHVDDLAAAMWSDIRTR